MQKNKVSKNFVKKCLLMIIHIHKYFNYKYLRVYKTKENSIIIQSLDGVDFFEITQISIKWLFDTTMPIRENEFFNLKHFFLYELKLQLYKTPMFYMTNDLQNSFESIFIMQYSNDIREKEKRDKLYLCKGMELFINSTNNWEFTLKKTFSEKIIDELFYKSTLHLWTIKDAGFVTVGIYKSINNISIRFLKAIRSEEVDNNKMFREKQQYNNCERQVLWSNKVLKNKQSCILSPNAILFICQPIKCKTNFEDIHYFTFKYDHTNDEFTDLIYEKYLNDRADFVNNKN